MTCSRSFDHFIATIGTKSAAAIAIRGSSLESGGWVNILGLLGSRRSEGLRGMFTGTAGPDFTPHPPSLRRLRGPPTASFSRPFDCTGEKLPPERRVSHARGWVRDLT